MKHLLTILLFLAPVAAGAQTWSYQDCVDYARVHNIDLRKAVVSERQAEVTLSESEALWQPSLDFATTHSYTNRPWADGNRNGYNSTYGLNAGWTVWNGGQRENTIKKSRLLTEIQREQTADVMRTLETDLLQVYVNILYARESIGIYEEAARLSAAQADRARQLMEAGRASKVDYAQLKSQAENDAYSLVNARGLYDTRRMELKRLLELGLDTTIELQSVTFSPEEVLAELPDMQQSYALAIETDRRLRGLEMQEKSAQLDEKIARSNGLPTISLNAGVGTGYAAPGGAFGTSLKQSWNESVGITLAVPIFDRRKTKSEIARAQLQRLDARLDIDARLTELSQLVENWYIDTRSAQAQFTAARQKLEAAELSNSLTEAQFDLGLVNPVELMTAHNALTEARHSLLQTKYMAMLGKKMIEFYRNASVAL